MDFRIVSEDYIPLKICFGEETGLVNYFEFFKGFRSLVEIGVDKAMGCIKEITMVECDNFVEQSSPIPIREGIEGKICIQKVKNECNVFETKIYANGVDIIISSEKSAKYLKFGDVYIGISDSSNLTEICVYGMNELDILHIKRELAFCNK